MYVCSSSLCAGSFVLLPQHGGLAASGMEPGTSKVIYLREKPTGCTAFSPRLLPLYVKELVCVRIVPFVRKSFVSIYVSLFCGSSSFDVIKGGLTLLPDTG